MSRINEILEEMDKLKQELRSELEKEIDEKEFHKKWTFKEFIEYFKTIPLGTLLTSPIIYAMVIPAVILDVFLWIYQNINFRVYKIPLVKRSDYIFYDRQNLEYLHPIDKLGCVYCSYFNGLMAYSSEIASRTELYFCPIKHKKRLAYEHKYYKYFLPYGYDKYYEELENLRENLRNYNFTDIKPENYGIKR
jgi:hypothetical protein